MSQNLEPLEIVCYPDPILTKRARELTPEELAEGKAEGLDLRELTQRMIITMYHADGIGLAAPQVGLSLRFFVADVSDDRNQSFVVFNPTFSDLRGSVECEEGCLSLPEIRAKVKRPERIVVSGYDIGGHGIRFEADALLARVCQHETDHLDGKLFIQRIGSASRFLLRRSLRALEDDFALLQRRLERAKAKSDP